MNIFLILLISFVGLCYGIVPCPGGQYRCQDRQTCCQMPNGDYGCCPFPQATCCKDHTHCCPNGMKCDLLTQSCKKRNSDISVPMKMHEPVKFVELNKSKLVETLKIRAAEKDECPDGKPCSSNFTCCPIKAGGYGCCPLKDAMCCTDSIHCCPQGYTCNTTLGTCDKPDIGRHSISQKSLKQTNLLRDMKIAAAAVPPLSSQKEKETGKCPDPEYECGDKETCCKAAGGGYGCCPMPLATCCKDGVHCCPNGYKCVKYGCLPGERHAVYSPFFN